MNLDLLRAMRAGLTGRIARRSLAVLLLTGVGVGIGQTGSMAEGTAPVCQTPAGKSPSIASDHRKRLSAALQAGFGVQYWGQEYSAATLAQAPHGLLVIEAAKVGAHHTVDGTELFFSPEEISLINHGGKRPVIGYLNVAEIEEYRLYHARSAGEEARRWMGPKSVGGEQLAAYWRPEWRDILFERVDTLMALGLDGLFLDDVLHYYTHAVGETVVSPDYDGADAPQGAPANARAMMALVEELAARARETRCDAVIVVNNGAFIGRDAGPEPAGTEGAGAFDHYLAATSAILAESVFDTNNRQPTIDALTEDFLDRGVQVMSIDFRTHFTGKSGDSYRELVARRADQAGFVAYVADDEVFDRLYRPITAPAIR